VELAVLVGDSGDYLAGFIVEDGGALKLCKSMIVIWSSTESVMKAAPETLSGCSASEGGRAVLTGDVALRRVSTVHSDFGVPRRYRLLAFVVNDVSFVGVVDRIVPP
jgi:hypothetical protein